MNNNIYGYARVSAKDQCEDRQLIALKKFSIPEKNIYIDKTSGKNFERPKYKRLIQKVKAEDLIVVKSIDRLGRNYNEILEQWRYITKEKKANIFVIDMPLLDTRHTNKDLTGVFVADLVLQILSYVAQAERDNIRQRQREGIAAARKRGVKFGRPCKQIPKEFETIKKNGKIIKFHLEKLLKCLKFRKTLFFVGANINKN